MVHILYIEYSILTNFYLFNTN